MLIWGSYLVATSLWVFVTTAMALIVTRMYVNAIFATSLGRVKKKGAKATSDAPFVTVMLPLYNEVRVVDRLLGSVTSIDYPNYEVIVADDSTDEAMARRLAPWGKRRAIKVVHRSNRHGFKAGAINNAMKHVDRKCRYLLVFDADYVPHKEIIWQMLDDFTSKDIAVVQGYTKHTLNASKNFLTKSSSLAFSAFSLVDLPSRKRLNGFVPVCGSVFMISKKALDEVGGFDESSITEDWEITSRLVQRGYTILYDEGIAVPAECPSTFRVLLRQQMRWAEGITRDTKKHLRAMLLNKKINAMKKFDYLFYGLSSLNGITGTAAYALTIFVFMINQRLITVLGVDRGLLLGLGAFGQFLLYVAPVYIPLALISASVMALYRENRLRDSRWCGYLFLVSLTLAPFVAFAGLKGLLTKRGSWMRTFKTGEVTRSASPG